jgi:hypothetical protein
MEEARRIASNIAKPTFQGVMPEAAIGIVREQVTRLAQTSNGCWLLVCFTATAPVAHLLAGSG